MSTLLPKIRTNRGNVGNEIWIHLPDLSSFESTYLSGDEAAAQTVLSVISGVNFAADQYVIIGIQGAEQTEIRKVSSATDSTITISAGTSFNHVQGTIVTFIPFNQIEVYSATSAGGTYSLLSAVDIRADSLETYYPRTTDDSTIYYKARFKNVASTTYSDYSDEVSATGYAYNSVWSIKNRALDQLGEKIGGIITDSFLNESLWEARREFDNQFKRWSFRTSFDSDIGNLTEGQYSIAVPALLRNPDSPQNILGLRVGSSGRPIRYIDKTTWNRYYQGVFHTTVATQPAVGQITLVLTNVRDFEDSGSITIGSNTITYTAKDNTTNTLSGIPASGTGSITATHAAGTDAWQHSSFGEPMFYTIFEDKLYFERPIDSDFEGDNLYMDFYRNMPEYNSDADLLDEPDVDMFVSYLKYAIKDKKSKGTIKIANDPDYSKYILKRNSAVKGEFINQGVSFSPDIAHLIDID